MRRYIEVDALIERFKAEHDWSSVYIVEDMPKADEYEIAKEYCKKRCLAMVDLFYLRSSANYQQPTGDVVSKEKYDELNERYHRLLESAKILSDAVSEYERREDV